MASRFLASLSRLCPRSASSADGVAARARWLGMLLKVHWMSSAVCLLGMVLFSITGLTLNHAAGIESQPKVERIEEQLPAPLLAEMRRQLRAEHPGLPPAVALWLNDRFRADFSAVRIEWSEDEIYFPLPRPGGDAWLRIDPGDGAVEYELTDRGWIAWLNDLHKGRHTGTAWAWFIDLFAVACLLFSLSGLLILQYQAERRPSTWPLVGAGILLPLLLALFFIH